MRIGWLDDCVFHLHPTAIRGVRFWFLNGKMFSIGLSSVPKFSVPFIVRLLGVEIRKGFLLRRVDTWADRKEIHRISQTASLFGLCVRTKFTTQFFCFYMPNIMFWPWMKIPMGQFWNQKHVGWALSKPVWVWQLCQHMPTSKYCQKSCRCKISCARGSTLLSPFCMKIMQSIHSQVFLYLISVPHSLTVALGPFMVLVSLRWWAWPCLGSQHLVEICA